MDILSLFQKMLMLFGVMLTGYIAAKAGALDRNMNKKLSALICMLTNPAQVLSSVLSGDHPMESGQVLVLTAVAVCMYAVLIALALLLPKLLNIKNKREAGVYRYMLIFSNISYMGFPVIEALFGAGHTFYLTVFVLVFQLICWSYGVTLMSGERVKLTWKVLLRPMIIAPLAAYALYFIDIRPLWTLAPKPMGWLYGVVHTVGDLTPALSMLIIGCSLAQMDLHEVFNKWRIYVLAAIKLLLLPVLGWFVLHGLLKDEVLLTVTVIILAMPVATSATITSYQYGGDEKAASAGVFITTVLSIVTVPAMLYLLFFRL